MREVTYSQGLLIEDPSLVSTLAVFCETIWLPETTTAEAVAAAIAADIPSVGSWPKGEAIVNEIRSSDIPVTIQRWEHQYRPLFQANVFKRLPRSLSGSGEHAHRDDFEEKSIEEVYGTEKPLYERLALRYHLMRADLPGTELFESGKAKQRVDLAKAVFFLELPKLDADTGHVMELREAAQKADIRQFWQMIDEQAAFGEAEGKPALVRAEKIRAEFKKWKEDFFKFRGTMLGTGLLTALCWYSSLWAPLATFAAMAWLGDVNRWWVARKGKEHRAFKFISRIDSKLAEFQE